MSQPMSPLGPAGHNVRRNIRRLREQRLSQAGRAIPALRLSAIDTGERRIVLTLRPPSLIDRLWYWSINLPVPASTSDSPGRWMRLLPQSWARLHRTFAQRHHLFWLPCDLCNRHYGGHQAAGSIPDPTAAVPWGRSIGICPSCTRDGRSWRVTHPLEAVLAEIDGRRECDHDPLVQDCTQCSAYDSAVRTAVSTWKRHSERDNPHGLGEGP